jgi:tetratricopeptide (TPR) repeat protein
VIGRHSANEPDIFLSSPLREFEDVRAEITALAPSRFWALPTDLATDRGTPPFAVVDRMMSQIRSSSMFVCVLSGRYGTSVYERTESVSILETEIYHAALFHRNAHFFLMEPFDADERLSGLLDIVRTLRPEAVDDRPRPKREILDAIGRIVETSKPEKPQSRALSIRRLVLELSSRRGRNGSDIEFFDRVFRKVSDEPDRDAIERELAKLADEPRMEHRLIGMWIALRELSAAPYDSPAFKDYLPLWNAALGAWASAAAWLGLHGHLYAGRLAAVNSLLRVRAGTDSRELEGDLAEHIQGTQGARASEYYSIAKLVGSVPSERAQYLQLALKDVEQALKTLTGDVSGYLAIRGKIYAAQGRLDLAMHDFCSMLRMRKERDDPAGVGQALADIGFVYLKEWSFTKALKHLNEAVELLETARNYPFLVRALRVRAAAQAANGLLGEARASLLRAYDIAVSNDIHSQITPLMEVLHDPFVLLDYLGRRRP